MLPADTKVHPERTKKKPAKKPFYIPLFVFFLIGSTFLGFQQYLTFIGYGWLSLGIALGLTLPPFIAIICIYRESTCELLKLFILMDNFSACWLVSLLSMIDGIKIFDSFFPDNTSFTVTAVIINVDFFFCIGVYRMLFKYVQWKNWQIILNKACLFAILAVHINMASELILSQTTPEQLKEFAFIYVFGYFSFFYEIFSKFTEIDGTGNLETDYHPVGTENEDEDGQ